MTARDAEGGSGVMKMKAGVVHGKRDVRFEEIERPRVIPGTVLVKVKYTGICGSDIPRVFDGACHSFPIVLGHEFSGTVAEVGPGVNGVRVGDRVAGVPLVPCMKCADCMRGNYSLCKNYSFVGSRQNGSFAEYVLLPESNVVGFSESVSFECGAFFEPATVALHGLRRFDYAGGKNVAILGGGTVGMFTAEWARIFGAKSVTVFDVLDERLGLAKRLGADECVNSSKEDPVSAAMRITVGRGYDYVYETAGNTETIKLAFSIVGNRGGVCCIGTPTRSFEFDSKLWEQVNRKEFTLTGSWMSYSAPFPGSEWECVAHYFATGDLKIDDSFIFRKIPLSEISSAFSLFGEKGRVRGKILIDSER